ncbi:response regulator transcription factor [Marinigracilibium pacificum]|uniref:Helix-turn-helix transcriptional regulator n=1 Tax=Marinigracilibium pacificum TaxID=2729599 RepID=A0A848J362_9BACT|nr:helix-turn-helix transcriptional regulator [Marinigracilibium pacificum]NMM49945.1 helix-turn-helix transcriptional regulator [Marinigracilibium pacificum]
MRSTIYANPLDHKIRRIIKQEEFRLSHINQFQKLTPREKEIIELVIDGLNNKDISDQLFISRSTVEQHRKNINRKLAVRNVMELYRFALAFDLV